MDAYNNCLGLDILFSFNCTIDVQDERLTLRDFKYTTVNHTNWKLLGQVYVEDKEVTACIDTGSSAHMWGSVEMAQSLNLPLTDVSDENIKVKLIAEKAKLLYECYGFRLKVDQREFVRSLFYVDSGPNIYLIVGIQALREAVINLYHDASFEIIQQGETDEEQEILWEEADAERDEEYSRRKADYGQEQEPFTAEKEPRESNQS